MERNGWKGPIKRGEDSVFFPLSIILPPCRNCRSRFALACANGAAAEKAVLLLLPPAAQDCFALLNRYKYSFLYFFIAFPLRHYCVIFPFEYIMTLLFCQYFVLEIDET